MRLEDIENITVLGIGVMGPDISLGFALAGYRVRGVDVEPAAVDRAQKKLKSNLQQMVQEGFIGQTEAQRTRSRITFTLSWEDSVVKANFITEAVPEEMETKQKVFQRCDELCGPEVVVATNTSSMNITQIASKMRFPERAMGTHWTIPAHLSPMVEVIRGEHTSQMTEELTFKLLQRAGKIPVRCKNTTGFIHNYIQFSMVKAALDLVEAGHASPEDIDAVVKNGFGLRLASVGPVQFVDMCGLDTILNIQRYMYKKTQNPVYKPSEIIQKKVAHGDLGIKSGQGFFTYHGKKPENFWEKVNRQIMRVLKAT
jgi:3-hydroxybutyryl-CoA dehydrogenase